MGLVKLLSASESIYKIQSKPLLHRPVKIAIDSSGNEYFVESIVDDKRMVVTHPEGIRCKVWSKGFRITNKEEGYQVKSLKKYIEDSYK